MTQHGADPHCLSSQPSRIRGPEARVDAVAGECHCARFGAHLSSLNRPAYAARPVQACAMCKTPTCFTHAYIPTPRLLSIPAPPAFSCRTPRGVAVRLAPEELNWPSCRLRILLGTASKRRAPKPPRCAVAARTHTALMSMSGVVRGTYCTCPHLLISRLSSPFSSTVFFTTLSTCRAGA